ncbi:MAG: hypothetical protein U0Q11_06975 [Vicinamibacterales bacterium]
MLPASIQVAPPAFDAVTAYGIATLALLVPLVFAWVVSCGRVARVLLIASGAAIIMAIAAVNATNGRLARFDSVPPPMMVMIVGVLLIGLTFGLSSLGRDAAAHASLAALVALQSFRVPLELVMHRAGTLGIMPTQLSFGGYNFDIVTGIGASVLGGVMLAGRSVPKRALWVWNLWGIWCLLVIVAIAITTSPMVRVFGDDPRDLNTWVLYFPYVWLPVSLVTVAIASHVIITRALRLR